MNESFRNIILFILSVAYLPWRGTARKKVGEPHRVCIIQLAQLGDMICTTPMFRAVKERYPQAEVYVVGKSFGTELLAGNPDITGYIIWHNNPWEIVRKIRALKCDFGAPTGPNFIALAVLFLGGVKSIAAAKLVDGTSPLENRPYRMLRSFTHVVPHILTAYVPREYLRLLEPIGITTSVTKKYLYYSPEALEKVKQELLASSIKERPFAILAPGTGHWAKRWPPERFAQVAYHIASTYMPVVVVGAVRDAQNVREMMEGLTHPDVINFSEKFSLDETKALISLASFFIGGDTGPLFIAECFGLSTVCIAGPVDATQPPRGPNHILLLPPREKPAMAMFNTIIFDRVEAKRQAEATQAHEAIEAIDKLLGR